MIYDRLENAECYFASDAWKIALDYVRKAPPDLADGVYPLQGETVTARVMSYPSRQFQDTVLESHQKYIDLQVVLTGQEFVEVSTTSELTESTPYSAEKDAAFYFAAPNVSFCRLLLDPGRFVILFPQDAHRTQLRVGNNAEQVKKVVIKIALDALKP